MLEERNDRQNRQAFFPGGAAAPPVVSSSSTQRDCVTINNKHGGVGDCTSRRQHASRRCDRDCLDSLNINCVVNADGGVVAVVASAVVAVFTSVLCTIESTLS
jgi:hypothetical protein